MMRFAIYTNDNGSVEYFDTMTLDEILELNFRENDEETAETIKAFAANPALDTLDLNEGLDVTRFVKLADEDICEHGKVSGECEADFHVDQLRFEGAV